MFTNNKLAKSVRLAIAFGAAATALPASQAFAAEEEGEAIEKIEVTGSRIKRSDMETSSPVQITSAEDIKVSGFTRVEDMLNTLPQIEASSTAFQANGASGRGGVDMRGLGQHRTLVLVNGRRMQPGGGSSGAADVNSIPSALVKRVEVMTGGGSSVYGADAVAGVVNFVLDKEFEGFRVDLSADGYQHNNSSDFFQEKMDAKGFEYPEGQTGIDGKSYSIDVTAGGNFDNGKGNAVGYVTWRRTTELLKGSRDYSSCAMNSWKGKNTTGAEQAFCGGSANAIIPNFDIYAVNADGTTDYERNYWASIDSASNFIDSPSSNRYNYNPVNHYMRPDEKFSVGAFVNYEVNDAFNPYMEVMYMRDQTTGQIAESGTFFAEEYIIDLDNPIISDAQRAQLVSELGLAADETQFAAYIGKRNVEGGPRANLIQHDSFRIVLGSEGELSDSWTYDVSMQVGSTTNTSFYKNDFFAPRLTDAIANNEYSVFTYQGVTPEQAAPLTGVAGRTALSDQFILSGFATGELDVTLPTADSPIAVVVGAEYRDESFENISDDVYEYGMLLGQGGPTKSLTGGYDVTEIYGEASIPVISDMPGVESLVVELGYRYSDYSTSGAEPTYKAAVDWTVMEGWKVRASYNRAVRAPNMGELFAAQSQGLWGGNDPCSGATPAYNADECANTGVTTSQYGNITPSPASQYNGIYGGNLELTPELADTVTLGLVGQITDTIDFSVDYFKIDIEDVIGTVPESVTLAQCALSGDAAYCDNITRAPNGSLWLGNDGYIQATDVNLGGRAWEGVDFTAGWSEEMWGGNASLTFVGTHMMKKEYEPIPGDDSATYDCAGVISQKCFPQPEWRHVVNFNFDRDNYGLNVKWRFFGSVENDELVLNEPVLDKNTGLQVVKDGLPQTTSYGDLLLGDQIDAQSYIDVAVRYSINETLTTRIGVNNIFDVSPPEMGETLRPDGFYDQLGRYIHASVSFSF